MADFNPKTIKGNIGGVYFTKTKEAVDPFNLTKYNPNTNQNIILFYLEDGVENNIVTVNFAPNDSSMPKKGWTSHDFPAIFRGYVDHTVNGEAIPRTFAQYLALVPTLITDLNLNNKKPLSFNATVIQQSGVNLLGSFNTLNDLINAHTPTESLHDNDAIAYVYENGQNGYYKVYFSSGSSTWYWGVYQGAISTSLSEVQYNLTGLQVQGGFRNPAPIVPLQDEQYRIIWQHLNELYAQYSVVEGELGELEQEIIELNTAVVKTISKTDTSTIIIGLTRIDNDVNIRAVVNVSNNSYNLLKVVGSDGLEVNPEDIINEIVFEINNTNSTLRQAIDDIVDGKITTHNTNSEAHQDIRDDYTQQITDLQDVKLNKIWADITEQTTTNLTDILVFNRGSNVYKTTVANLLAHVAVVELFTVVAELPEVGLPTKIYLVPSSDPETQNTLEEFIWVNNDWEKIGSVSVDLSNFDTKSEVDGKITTHNTNSEAHQDIRGDIGDLKLDIQTIEQSINGLENNKVDKNANITPGTHTKITYDAKGLVTAGADLVATDIPNLDAGKITTGTFGVDRIPVLAPSKITQDASNRFVTDTEKTTWNNKVDKVSGKGLSTNDLTNTLKTNYDTAYTHSQTAHAPSNAQKNSDITKAEIEAKLTGQITTHNHDDRYYTETEIDTKLVGKANTTHTHTKSQISDLIEATQSLSGLMSATDKQRLDVLHALLEEDTENNVVDSINEVLAIFNNYPEGADLVTALAGKVDKVTGKGLSTNDLTNALKSNYDTAYGWGNHAVEGYLKSITKAMVEAVLTGTITTHNHDGVYEPANSNIQSHISSTSNPHSVTKTDVGLGNVDNTSDLSKPISTAQQTALDNKVDKVSGKGLSTNDFTNNDKNKLDGIEAGAEVNPYSKTQLDNMFDEKQDKLTAGDNITIDPTTNVISASGDGGYEPDGVTIVLNNSNELEVSKDLEVEWTKVVNKPTFSTVATTGNYNDLIGAPDLTTKLDKNFSTLPNQASPLLTDVLVINRGTVAQKTTLGNLLAQVDAEIFVVVATLPATGVVNKIYLLPKGTPESQDGYDEYIWVNNAWELIGSVKLDLSNYYNKTEVNGLLSAKVDKVSGKGLSTNDYTNTDKQSVEKIPTIEQDILDLESDKVDKVSGMGLSSNDFTTTEKHKLSGIQAGAQVNAVTTVAGRTGAVVLAKADVGLGSVQNYAIASKTEAESGTSNNLYMTPLRTKELITVVMGDIESALDAILGV